jgi:hypothetical protein
MLVHRVKTEIFFNVQFSTKHKLNIQLNYLIACIPQVNKGKIY